MLVSQANKLPPAARSDSGTGPDRAPVGFERLPAVRVVSDGQASRAPNEASAPAVANPPATCGQQQSLEDFVCDLAALVAQASPSSDRGGDFSSNDGAADGPPVTHDHDTSTDAKEGRVDAEPGQRQASLPPIVYKSCAAPQFRNDFFQVARSPTAGWGALAVKTLKRGDVVLRERPLFVADPSRIFDEYDKLGPQAKRVALSLHVSGLVKPGTPEIQAVWATNCFAVGGRRAGLFPVAARFNHACFPGHSVDFAFDSKSQCLVLTVRVAEVPAGHELRINYGRDRSLGELYMTYGFQCRCGGCPGLSDEDVLTLTPQW